MANRSFKYNWGTLAVNPITLFANFGIGAAGAVVAATTTGITGGGTGGFGPGIKTVVHTSTGVYTITFEDTYGKILTASGVSFQGTATQAQATAQVVAVSSITGNVLVLNTVLSSAPTVLADPASGIQISAEISLDNTSQPF